MKMFSVFIQFARKSHTMLKQLYKQELITENNPTPPVLFIVLARWGHKKAKQLECLKGRQGEALLDLEII